jgi:hypothetical protein
MGRVWLLEHTFDEGYETVLKNRIAVKTFDFMPQHFAIEQELNCWVSLDHVNILPLLRIGRLNYRVAAIMCPSQIFVHVDTIAFQAFSD